MQKHILVLSIVLIFSACKTSEKDIVNTVSEQHTEKKLFANTEIQIQKYRADSQKYWDKNDSKNALKYNDSIKNIIINSYVNDYSFKTIDNSIYDTSKRTKPLFLQVTASWCAPCKFEIPALNKIVKKYHDKVDFVLLFWDNQSELKKLASDYNEEITLIPSQKISADATTI